MTRPKLVLCAGVPRSGSTWLFNAARLTLERSGLVRGVWIGDLERHGDGTPLQRDGETLLVKLHEFDEVLADAADTVLTSRRDPVEIAASASRLGWARSDADLIAFIEGAIWKHTQWSDRSDYELAYERLAIDAPGELVRAAEALGDPMPAEQAERVCAQIRTLHYTGPEGTYDPKTLLHPKHISGKPAPLSPRQADLVRERFGPWMSRHGYLADAQEPDQA